MLKVPNLFTMEFNKTEMYHPPMLSINMLFGDLIRIKTFFEKRIIDILNIENISYEILIAMNSLDIKKESVPSFIKEIKAHIKIIWTGVNNLPYARNLLASHSEGNFILIWDDDCEILPGGVNYMLEKIQSFPAGIVGLLSKSENGNIFKPASFELTFQCPEIFGDLLIVPRVGGMAFVTYRKILQKIPEFNFLALRGEWLEWYSRLWQHGIIPTHALSDKYYIIDHALPGMSATKRSDRLFHIFLYLLTICYFYKISKKNYSWNRLRDLTLEENLPEEDKIYTDIIWEYIVNFSNSNFSDYFKNLRLTQSTNFFLNTAVKQFSDNLRLLDRFRLQYYSNLKYKFGPFEIFEENNRSKLLEIIRESRKNLNNILSSA